MQKYRKTILIICEGERSEPDYFHHLRNEVIEKNKDKFIKILPIPKEEQQKIEQDFNNFKVRKGGRLRKVRPAIGQEPDNYEVESKDKAQPICYVRKAQY